MLRFLRALFVTLQHGWEWLVLHVTGRDLAGERAQRADAQLQAAEAEQKRLEAEQERLEAEARHQEMMEATDAQTAETRLLREAIERRPAPVAQRPVAPSVAQRREAIARQSRSHDIEIRSSTWRDEPELQDVAAIILDRAG